MTVVSYIDSQQPEPALTRWLGVCDELLRTTRRRGGRVAQLSQRYGLSIELIDVGVCDGKGIVSAVHGCSHAAGERVARGFW